MTDHDRDPRIKCSNCRFFDSSNRLCRYHAPAMPSDDADRRATLRAMWPTVDADDWCGRFERRPGGDEFE